MGKQIDILIETFEPQLEKLIYNRHSIKGLPDASYYGDGKWLVDNEILEGYRIQGEKDMLRRILSEAKYIRMSVPDEESNNILEF